MGCLVGRHPDSTSRSGTPRLTNLPEPCLGPSERPTHHRAVRRGCPGHQTPCRRVDTGVERIPRRAAETGSVRREVTTVLRDLMKSGVAVPGPRRVTDKRRSQRGSHFSHDGGISHHYRQSLTPPRPDPGSSTLSFRGGSSGGPGTHGEKGTRDSTGTRLHRRPSSLLPSDLNGRPSLPPRVLSVTSLGTCLPP